MIEAKEFYEEFEKRFIQWGQEKEDIRAAFIVGSRARSNHPADECSDLDIVFYTSRQEYYLREKGWLNRLGKLTTAFSYQTAGGDPECLTLFEGGWQVDFVIHRLDELEYAVQNKIIPGNFYRGVKVLMDKDQRADNILPKEVKQPEQAELTQDVFLTVVNMFWFSALYLAKQVKRNELWVVKARDSDMKQMLLQMIEWHEKVVNGADYDTWHAGRFLHEWASKEIQEELQNSFGHYDRKDSLKALKASIQIFKHLAHEVADMKKFSYSINLEKSVMEWIERNLQRNI